MCISIGRAHRVDAQPAQAAHRQSWHGSTADDVTGSLDVNLDDSPGESHSASQNRFPRVAPTRISAKTLTFFGPSGAPPLTSGAHGLCSVSTRPRIRNANS